MSEAAGHWKFMAVVDETPECRNAVRFAARRAKRVGGGLVLLYIIQPADFQHWVSVGEVMRQEARDEAAQILAEISAELREQVGLTPEFKVREGEAPAEILAELSDDPDIHILMLGACTSGKNPGPLVSAFTGKMAGELPVPLTIVPDTIPLETLDKLA